MPGTWHDRFHAARASGARRWAGLPDYNATTPVDPRVAEVMAPHLAVVFGIPSSGHAYGAEPRRTLATARTDVAALIEAQPREIVFTASGSEANLLAVRGRFRPRGAGART